MGQVRQDLSSRSEPVAELGLALQALADNYDPSYLPTDPLKFVHRYENPRDQEVVAFLVSILAFGNVKAIFQSSEQILKILGGSPFESISQWSRSKPAELNSFRHRWITSQDMHALFCWMREILNSDQTLEAPFRDSYAKTGNLMEAMAGFSDRFPERQQTQGLRFMLPSPREGSACKRLNLFLRWMVRSEYPDLGTWTFCRPSELFLPVDTHLARIVRYVGLTQRVTPGWAMVEEVTERLRDFAPDDPIKFDFALSRLGILRHCRHRADEAICPACPLKTLCIVNNGQYT